MLLPSNDVVPTTSAMAIVLRERIKSGPFTTDYRDASINRSLHGRDSGARVFRKLTNYMFCFGGLTRGGMLLIESDHRAEK